MKKSAIIMQKTPSRPSFNQKNQDIMGGLYLIGRQSMTNSDANLNKTPIKQ